MSSSLNFFNGVPLASVKHARFLTRAGDFYSIAKLIFNRKTYNFSDAAENGAVCYGSNYANWVFIAPDDRFDWDAMAEMTFGDMMTYVIEIATASPVPAWDEFVAWLNGESETLDKVLNACTRAYLAASDPVPAGGVYTECNVPKLTGSTDFPGFAACLKDATTPAHEEAAASFRTADKAFSFGIELWGADSETGKEQKAATLLFTVRE